jgi:hypothetical protein
VPRTERQDRAGASNSDISSLLSGPNLLFSVSRKGKLGYNFFTFVKYLKLQGFYKLVRYWGNQERAKNNPSQKTQYQTNLYFHFSIPCINI